MYFIFPQLQCAEKENNMLKSQCAEVENHYEVSQENIRMLEEMLSQTQKICKVCIWWDMNTVFHSLTSDVVTERKL